MRVVDIALAVVAVLLATCGLALIVSVWLSTGPNCPAPVPAEWLGFCDAYEGE